MHNAKKPEADLYTSMANKMTSTPEVITAVVEEALNKTPLQLKRLVLGVGNEVYRIGINTDPAQDVILRLHHSEHPEFGYEKWALEESAKQGVPVPTVLAIGNYELPEKSLAYSVETLVPGEPLEDLLARGIPNKERLAYAEQAGEILARIHSVKTTGHGHLLANGFGKFDTLLESMQQHDDYPDLAEAIKGTALTAKSLDAAIALIDHVNMNEPPHLVHVDYAPKHIFVEDGQISGVIDFEICLSGYAATDFNRWRAQESRITIAELIPGYEKIRKLPDNFWNFLYVVQVHSALRTILYHHRTTGHAGELQKAAAEAQALLESGKALAI